MKPVLLTAALLALILPSAASAQSTKQEDGLSRVDDAYVERLTGTYELWENIGDDGKMCEIQLTDMRTIAGYQVKADPACLKEINATGLFAWFLAPQDGHIVMIDATRKPLMRLRPSDNPRYFDNQDFYLTRAP
jgi:hypothetical protein